MNTYNNSNTRAMILYSCVSSLSPWRVNFQGHRRTTKFFYIHIFRSFSAGGKTELEDFYFPSACIKVVLPFKRVVCMCASLRMSLYLMNAAVVCRMPVLSSSHQPNWGPCMSLLSSGVSVSVFACFVCESGRQHCSQRRWRTHLHGLCTFPLRLPL